MKLSHFKTILLILGLFIALGVPSLHASIMTFNSSGTSDVNTTRNNWLAAIGITIPAYLVEFESGFVAGQNISGVTGLFPEGMVIKDTSTTGSWHGIIIKTTNGIGGADPVGLFGAAQNENPFLELSFSNPIDYVAFRDIDHTGFTGIVTFVGGGTASISKTDTANEAEFFGIYRNDMPKITKVEFDASGDGTWGIDNIEYGPAAPIPEPATMLLLGSGLLGLAGLRKKFRK